jgi:hypothetical protein
MSNKYNGYTNYETWNLSLWLDNNREWYRAVNDKALNLVNDVLTKDEAIYNLKNFIIDLVQNDEPKIEPSFFSDVLNASIREVNFWEISQNLIYEARKSVADDLKDNRKSA